MIPQVLSELKAFEHFSLPYNGLVTKLTGPQVTKIKINQNQNFVGTDGPIKSWKFHVDPLETVSAAMTQWPIFLEVWPLDLTW